MPQGLEIYDSSGALKFDPSIHTTRVVDYFDSGVESGFRDYENEQYVTYFTVVIPSTANRLCPPTTSISGSRVQWDWLAPPGVWRAPATIIVGAF